MRVQYIIKSVNSYSTALEMYVLEIYVPQEELNVAISLCINFLGAPNNTICYIFPQYPFKKIIIIK